MNNKTTEGRGGQNEGGGGEGNTDRSVRHTSLLWSEDVMHEAYDIYDTLNLCFPDTKTNKSKTAETMTTDNVNCDHDTVREGVNNGWNPYNPPTPPTPLTWSLIIFKSSPPLVPATKSLQRR